MAVKGKGLGRGLDALIPSYEDENLQKKQGTELVNISYIKPNPGQPRKSFDPKKIKDLSDSIKKHGIIQPIIVTKEGSYYSIVAGERRYRAAVLAGLKEVPVIEKSFSDEEIVQIALIENLQREDLNPVEEALAFQQLSEEFHMTQEQIASTVGRSRAAIANTIRLLTLSDAILSLIKQQKISAGHARAILSIENESDRYAFAEYIVTNDLSVREAERLSKAFSAKEPKKKKQTPVEKAPYMLHFEDELRQAFGTKVTIIPKGEKGKIELEYYSNDDLERLIHLLNNETEV